MLLVVINGRILIEKTAIFCYNLVVETGCKYDLQIGICLDRIHHISERKGELI